MPIPHLPEIETSVLGYCFSEASTSAWSTLVRLSDDDPVSLFYTSEGALVASAIDKSLTNDSHWNESSIKDTLEVLLGDDAINSPREIVLDLISEMNIYNEDVFTDSVKRLVEKRTMRRLLHGLEKVSSKITDPETPSNLDSLYQELSGLMMHSSVDDGIRSMGELIEELTTQESAPWVVPTGVTDLDNALGGGYQPGRMYIVAAETKIGKTTLAMNSTVTALENDAAAIFLSLETLDREFYGKMLATQAFIPQQKAVDYVFSRITKDDFTDEELELFEEGDQFLRNAPLYPMFSSDVRNKFFSSLTGAIMSVKSKHGMDTPMILVVDHLQLSTDGDGGDNRFELEQRTKGLKRLATDLEIPIILLSQLNRSNAEGDMPSVKSLKGSGSIEQDADAVIMLNRKGHYDPMEPEHILDISVPVARMGVPTMIKANWDGEHNTISDLDDGASAYTPDDE